MRTSPAARRPLALAAVVLAATATFGFVPQAAHAATRSQTVDVSTLDSSTIDISKATNVAPVKDGHYGATFTVYATPSTASPIAKLTNGKQVIGRVVFTVIEDHDDWLKVNAPMRANGGVGWVQSSIIDKRFNHDWRIRIEVGAKRLTVTKGSAVVFTDKVAVGTAKTPTPLGTFYTVDLIKSKKPKGAYGPYAYGLSAFSAVYQKFGAGDGRIGLHGTNEPAKVGTAVSNGCIRMTNASITKLASMLPLGVPVDIVA